MKKTGEKKRPKFEVKEDVLMLVAYASLKNRRKSTGPTEIEIEKSRLERIAEEFYKKSKDIEYNQFIIDWVKSKAHDIVYTDAYMYDAVLPDEPYELNVNLFCRK
jgi:hypothetical protein